MKARISATTLKRLGALEQQRGENRPAAMFPRLVQVDEWGALASRMQGILKDNVVKDEAPDYGDLPKLELVASR
ncbi:MULTISPECIES: hypothetical protein [unclassified Marinobacter]|uniref:hypothetical protein n=1 Tax=unclassified Marinobacter TaxID=83889 RepID=UPI000BF50071|nr:MULTISPECIES: hypothetical protein [unclassified Marinobacter]PFG10018.1 hypothetical protein ATI45_2428 [Marinobacter sp. LV10MA510-1]PFG51943.1 hypothetical protein ATG98_0922 [Marinobacter sp. LV10R520-4]